MFIVITLKIGEIIHKLILKYLLWYIKLLKEALKNEKAFISGLIIFIIFFASGAMTWFTIDKINTIIDIIPKQ